MSGLKAPIGRDCHAISEERSRIVWSLSLKFFFPEGFFGSDFQHLALEAKANQARYSVEEFGKAPKVTVSMP